MSNKAETNLTFKPHLTPGLNILTQDTAAKKTAQQTIAETLSAPEFTFNKLDVKQ